MSQASLPGIFGAKEKYAESELNIRTEVTQ